MIHPPITTAAMHFEAFEPDRLLGAVKGAHLEHYILGRSRCSARLFRWSCGSFCVDMGNYSFPVRVVGELPRTKLCIGYMRRVSQPAWVNGFFCDQATIELYPENSELNYRAAPNAEWTTVEFDLEALQSAARKTLGHEVDLSWKHVTSFPIPVEVRATLDQMIQQLWLDPLSRAIAITPVLGMIAAILHDARNRFGTFARPVWIKRQKMLTRADQHLQANLSSPFDLAALARATGATKRTLQREFVISFGMTPRRWARCLALHCVRKRLRGHDGRRLTVEAIAYECGFRHMGRFASYYLQLFGEHPSQTQRATQQFRPH